MEEGPLAPPATKRGGCSIGMADAWQEDTVDEEFICNICMEVMIEPTSACPDGHCCCRLCYVQILRESAKECATCLHPTDESRLVRNRHLENVINKLRVKCKHAAEGATSGADARSRTTALVGLPIKELRAQLRRACLETQGQKDDLVARLVAWQVNPGPKPSPEP